jgi:glyoxylase-like metal-dependent hydrolase (beta-lactamase superfamily II)
VPRIAPEHGHPGRNEIVLDVMTSADSSPRPATLRGPDNADRLTWAEPGVYEVAPDVFRVPLPLPNDGLRAVNVYVIRTDNGVALVDAGWAIEPGRDALAAGLAALDLGFADITRFLVTHVHRDHYSQAVVLRDEFGGRVSLGSGDRASLDVMMTRTGHPLEDKIDVIRSYGAAAFAEELSNHFSSRAHPPLPGTEYPDEWLSGGEQIPVGRYDLAVVATPGHTQGHMVFHALEHQLLFAGDHVLPTITPSIGFEPAWPVNPLGAFLGSLATVRARPDSRLLPAHGPVTESAHARIDELVEHHGRRLDQVEAAVGAGSDTCAEVAAQLRWTRREHRLDDLDLFNRLLALCETGAHLELLVAQGRVTRTDIDGVAHFSL